MDCLLLLSLVLGQAAPEPTPLPPGTYFFGPEVAPTDLVAPGERRRDMPSEAVMNQVAPAVLEAHPAFLTSRSGSDFGYHLPVPPGRYTLRIGYVETLYRHPENRVFTILVNGAPVARNVDLVVEAGMEAKDFDRNQNGKLDREERDLIPQHWVQELEIDHDADALRLRFLASRELNETVSVAWIELAGKAGRYFIDCGGDGDPPGEFEDDPLGQAVLARFGSRAFFDLRPQFGEFHESPLGMFSEHHKLQDARVLKPFAAMIGFVTLDGDRKRRYQLPLFRDLSLDEDNVPFDSVREERTLTSLRYRVQFAGIDGTITFRSAFHPTDAMIATAPVYEVEFTAHRISSDAPPVVRAVFFLPVIGKRDRPMAKRGDMQGIIGVSEIDGCRAERGLFIDAETSRRLNAMPQAKNRGLSLTFDMPLHQGVATASMIYAAYVPQPVLTVNGEPHRFYYTKHFANLEDVAAWGLANRAENRRLAQVIDGLVGDAVVPDGMKQTAIHAFPSFLLNSFMTVGPDGDWWYSSMEGFCRYHATVDVEYSAAPFYLWFAPDLLRHLLDAWSGAIQTVADGPLAGRFVLSHDLGKDREVGAQQYPHDMPVEENTNYALLLHAYWTATGNTDFVRGKAPVVEQLLDYVVAADLDGDGFPEVGTANTIDDGPPAIQFSREQTYLAVKSAAAFVAGAEVLELGDERQRAKAAEWRAQAVLIRTTLDGEAWLDDHYAVCLDRTVEGLENPWMDVPDETNVPREAVVDLPEHGELRGWNSPHPYTSLGLYYLLRGGVGLPLDRERLLTDLRTAAAACARRFADAHTREDVNGWVSLDMFRDAVQCYLGDDVTERAQRYADLQHYRARCPDERDRAGFCDSMYNRYLSYYPRGTAVFGLFDAAAGVVLDQRKHSLRLRPVRAPLKVPLPYLADWDELRVPWFEVTRDAEGRPVPSFTNQDLLADLDVVVDLTLLGGDVTTHTRQ